MKLAEALAQRSDAQKRLAQLQSRAEAAARYQEGETPAERAGDLVAEARLVVGEISQLIRKINKTNATVELEPGMTITDAIAERDALQLERRLLSAVADSATGGGDHRLWARQLRSELRQVTDIPVTDYRQQADAIAKRYRELDVRLQASNWSTELIE